MRATIGPRAKRVGRRAGATIRAMRALLVICLAALPTLPGLRVARGQDAERRLDRLIQRHREAAAEVATLDAGLAEDDAVREASELFQSEDARCGESSTALEAALWSV